MHRFIAAMLLVGLFAGGALSSGCATRSREAAPAPGVLKSVVGSSASERVQPGASVWGADRGLEIWTWVVADRREIRLTPSEGAGEAAEGETPPAPAYRIIDPRRSIEQALAPYADRLPPIDDELRFRLQAAGFRVLSVPVADLSALQASLRLVAPTQKQWLGEAAQWTDFVQGRSFDRSRTFAVDNAPGASTAHLGPGRLRLLGRAWIAPLPTEANPRAAALRLELVPQHDRQLSEPHRLLAGAANTPALERGRTFGRLGMGLYLRGDMALVLVPDSPHNDWASAAERGEPAETGAGEEEDAVNWPTLGEAMLSEEGSGRPARRTRAVVVLIPRVPESFDLR